MTWAPAEVPVEAFTLTATAAAAPTACRAITAFAVAHGADGGLVPRLGRAVTEAVAGIVARARPDGAGAVVCEADIEEGVLEIVVADREGGPRPVPAPGLDAALAAVGECSDAFTFTDTADDGTSIWMRFVLAPPQLDALG